MAGDATASHDYEGAASEPVPWSVLEEIFDVIFGRDVRDLKRYPETLHHVHARWQDTDGVEHEAESLTEVERAYLSYQTARVTLSGWRAGGKPCRFDYWPGGRQVRARAVVQAMPDAADEMITRIRTAFPLQRAVIFISWSGERGSRVAEAIRDVILPRLPAAAEVFLSTQMRPGTPPLHEMLDRNLLVADAHIVVVTQEAATSAWVMWETAASWARGKPVIPIFVDVRASDVEGPLPLLAQGVLLDNRKQLQTAIHEVMSVVGGNTDSALAAHEVESLRRVAE